jgi:hypothetical protein
MKEPEKEKRVDVSIEIPSANVGSDIEEKDE